MRKTLAAGIAALSTTFGGSALADTNLTIVNLDELLGQEVTTAIKGSGELDTTRAQMIELSPSTYNDSLPVTMCYDLDNNGTLSENEQDMANGYAVDATYNQALLVMNDGMLEPLKLDVIATEVAPHANSAALRSRMAKNSFDTYKGIEGNSSVKAIAIANRDGHYEALFTRQPNGQISALAIGPNPSSVVPAKGPCYTGPKNN